MAEITWYFLKEIQKFHLFQSCFLLIPDYKKKISKLKKYHENILGDMSYNDRPESIQTKRIFSYCSIVDSRIGIKLYFTREGLQVIPEKASLQLIGVYRFVWLNIVKVKLKVPFSLFDSSKVKDKWILWINYHRKT